MANEPSEFAQALPGIAAIFQAVAWPLVIGVLLYCYRAKLRKLLDVLIAKLDEADSVETPAFKLKNTKKNLQEQLTRVGAAAESPAMHHEIPERQIAAAREVREELLAAPIGFAQKLEVVQRQIEELASDYERIRREMVHSTPERTRRMNEIAAKMRALAFAAYPLLPSLIASTRVGERLAAICILQVEPELQQFEWLINRLKTEGQPFVLFHSALAILKLVKSNHYLSADRAEMAIQGALDHVMAFKGGQPDQNTIDVLNEALAALKRSPALT